MVNRWNLALTLLLAGGLFCLAPAATAIKVERDTNPPQVPAKPRAAAVPAPELPAEQIAERNVQARGGLKAWRAIQSIQMTGLLDAGGRKNTQLPFTLQM